MRRIILPRLGIFLVAGITMSCSGEPSAPTDLKPQYWFEDQSTTGRMTGGGGQVTFGGVNVTRGFTIHCDITLSNNLEINWGGNKWHLDKPLTAALCLDDPAISPEPPPAPFDTFNGEGIGRLNGVDGYRAKFTFIDAGEPGGNNDRAGIMITDPDGNVVLLVELTFLDRGNIQAHEDQPHRN